MQDIRTITLDLDDTLWAIRPVITRAEKALYAWLQENYPRITDRFSPENMLHMRENIATDYRDKSHDFTFLRRKVLGKVSAAAGYGDSPVDGAMALFSAYRNDVELFPEVRPALSALGEKYRVIAVTNGNANLDMIGIRDLFDDVVSASMAGAAKPARAIFDVAVKTGGWHR
jgi:putative hydrolase of the HAD superfamily